MSSDDVERRERGSLGDRDEATGKTGPMDKRWGHENE